VVSKTESGQLGTTSHPVPGAQTAKHVDIVAVRSRKLFLQDKKKKKNCRAGKKYIKHG